MSAKTKLNQPQEFIKTLEDLEHSAILKKSLMCDRECWDRPVAAAIVLSMQGRTILRYIEQGLYIYTPKPTSVFPRRKEKAL
jgi:hypothetical protein